MSNRLCDYDRRRMTDAVVTAVFQARKEKQEELGQKLAMAVRDKLIPGHLQELIQRFPDGFFCEPSSVQVSIPDTTKVVTLPLPNKTRMPENMKYGLVQRLPDKGCAKLIERIDAWLEENQAIYKEKEAFKAKVRGTLNACTTKAKVLELMPEMKGVMGESYWLAQAKSNLPVETANTINDQLKKALKEAA